jgi:hypothetical protein
MSSREILEDGIAPINDCVMDPGSILSIICLVTQGFSTFLLTGNIIISISVFPSAALRAHFRCQAPETL